MKGTTPTGTRRRKCENGDEEAAGGSVHLVRLDKLGECGKGGERQASVEIIV